MGKPVIMYSEVPLTATATSSITGLGDPDDVLIATEDTYHSPESTSSYYYTIDCGESILIDSIAVLASNISGALFSLHGSSDNFSASDVTLSNNFSNSNDNIAWTYFTNASTYRYYRLHVSLHSSNIRVQHICLDELVEYPYFETDPDPYNVKPEVSQLISQSGLYVGTNQTKAMREIKINWGEVIEDEHATILVWANDCIKTSRSFFLIPDKVDSGENVFFGWLDDGGKFSSPLENGVYKISQNTMITRAV